MAVQFAPGPMANPLALALALKGKDGDSSTSSDLEASIQKMYLKQFMNGVGDTSPVQSPWQGVARLGNGLMTGLMLKKMIDADKADTAAGNKMLLDLYGNTTGGGGNNAPAPNTPDMAPAPVPAPPQPQADAPAPLPPVNAPPPMPAPSMPSPMGALKGLGGLIGGGIGGLGDMIGGGPSPLTGGAPPANIQAPVIPPPMSDAPSPAPPPQQMATLPPPVAPMDAPALATGTAPIPQPRPDVLAAALGRNDQGDGLSPPRPPMPIPRPPMMPTPNAGFADAISGIESGGRYNLLGPVTSSGDRAYGKYQVMGNNIGPWSKEVLGQPVSKEDFLNNPQIQDAVFQGKFGQYAQKYGPEGAAKAWFAGERGMRNPNARDQLGTTVSSYASQFNRNLKNATPTQVASLGNAPMGGPPMPQPGPQPPAGPQPTAPQPGMLGGPQAQPMPQPQMAQAQPTASVPQPKSGAISVTTLGAMLNNRHAAPIAKQLIMQGLSPETQIHDMGNSVGIFDKRGNLLKTFPKSQDQIAPVMGPDNQPVAQRNVNTGKVESYPSAPGSTNETNQYNLYVRQAQQAGNQPMPFKDFMIEMNRSRRPETNVNVNSVANPVLKGLSEQFDKSRETANAATDSINVTHQMRQQLDNGMFTGPLANWQTSAVRMADALGLPVTPDQINKMANSESFVATAANAVKTKIKAFGSGSGITDTDREFTQQMVGGKITLNAESMRRILDINEKLDRFAIQKHNSMADKMLSSPASKDLGPYGALLKIDEPPEYKPMPAQGAQGATPAAPMTPGVTPDQIKEEMRRRGLLQ